MATINALYVAKRTSEGFVVRAKGTKANGRFGYRIVAKRKDIAAPRFEEVAMPKIGLRVNDSREEARETARTANEVEAVGGRFSNGDLRADRAAAVVPTAAA